MANNTNIRDLKIACMLDERQFSKKPTGYESGGIQKRLAKTELTAAELANALIKGHTFRPAVLKGRSDADWFQQQIFALDFDNDVVYCRKTGIRLKSLSDIKGFKESDSTLPPETICKKYGLTFKDRRTSIKEQIDRCVELNLYPLFGYTSFRHTETKNKFRLVFCADRIITDLEERRKIQCVLGKLFEKCDDMVFNPARLFYGGKGLFAEYYATFNASEVLETHYSSELDEVVDVGDIGSTKTVESTVTRKGVCNNKNNNNSSYYCIPQKPPPTKEGKENNQTYNNIIAFRNRDVNYLKSKFSFPEFTTNNNDEYMDYIKKLNLAEILEIENPKNFKCLFYKDRHPSASIFICNKTGDYLYKNFSMENVHNIVWVVEKLGAFKARPDAHKFIREIFNIKFVETEYQIRQKELLDENIRYLLNEDFKCEAPICYKNISRNISYLVMLCNVAKDNVLDESITDEEGQAVFFASVRHICRIMRISENSNSKISDKLALFVYHHLLNKLDKSEIPEKMLKRLEAISSNKDKNFKDVNFFSIPSFVADLIEEADEQAIKWKSNGYTMKGISREMFFRGDGAEVANKLYPQYKKVTVGGEVVDRTTTKASDKRTQDIADCDIFGYCRSII